MSRASQVAFLKKLHKRLATKSTPYRQVYNREVQVFNISKRAIIRGVMDGLRDAYPEEVLKKISTPILHEIDQFVKWLEDDIRKKVKTEKEFTLLPRKRGNILVEVSQKKGENKDLFTNVIKKIYKERLDFLTEDINDIIEKVVKEPTAFSTGEFFQLEHDNRNKGVLETYIRNSITHSIGRSNRTKEDVHKFLGEDLKLDLSIIRSDVSDTMEVFIGSTDSNAREGNIARSQKDKIVAALKTVLNDFEKDKKLNFVNLKGSDSLLDVQKKKTIRALVDAFRKKGFVIKERKSSKVSKNKRKANLEVQGQTKVNRTGPKKTGAAPKSFAGFPTPPSLLAVLNERIRDVVAANMHSPRLNYRSGRFASSVKIVDEARTAQGFRSIGYTYMKYPYQTFEPGFAQGSPDRDPKKLIDFSIREIAIGFAVGRLYTRRE